MQPVSDTYKQLLADKNAVFQCRVDIGGTVYDHGHIVDMVTYGSLFAETDGPGIGGVVSREITVTIHDYGTIERAARIRPYVRLVKINRMTGGITAVSEWIPKGIFFVDTRDTDEDAGTITLHGFDIMLSLANFPGYLGTLDWSADVTMTDYVNEVCNILLALTGDVGALDPRSVRVVDSITVPEPSEQATARDVMGWLAVLTGSNWTVTDDGKLRLVPLSVSYVEPVLGNENGAMIQVGDVLIGVQDEYGHTATYFSLAKSEERKTVTGAFAPITKLILVGDDGVEHKAGTDEGYSIYAKCGFADSDDWPQFVLETWGFFGFTYCPVIAENAFLDPAAELGDVVEIDGTYTQLSLCDTTFDELMTVNCGSPGTRDQEYPYHAYVSSGNSSNAGTATARRYTDRAIDAAMSSALQVRIVSTLPPDHASQNVLWFIPAG